MNEFEGAGRRSRVVAAAFMIATVSACGDAEDQPDAYGNFEAVETTVSAQASGELLSFTVSEGDLLERGQLVAQVDTVQLALNRAALEAQREAILTQIVSVHGEINVLEEQKQVALVEKRRVDRLYEQNAATKKQVDDIDGRLSILKRQIATTRTRPATLESQAEAVMAQIAQLTDQIERASIQNPLSGTVLTTFVEPYEIVSVGSPLYRIADLSTLDLRAYLGETQLTEIAIGDVVTVSYDVSEDELATVEGTVSWIASAAEFTPRTVQTRDERTNLVYAFKVRVPNPAGRLKVGMPADVLFSSPQP